MAELNLEKVDADIERLIERRDTGQNHANAEAERDRARDARRTHAARLVNAKAWCAYFGGLALAAHDTAARYSELRDEYAAIAQELETNLRGDAA